MDNLAALNPRSSVRPTLTLLPTRVSTYNSRTEHPSTPSGPAVATATAHVLRPSPLDALCALSVCTTSLHRLRTQMLAAYHWLNEDEFNALVHQALGQKILRVEDHGRVVSLRRREPGRTHAPLVDAILVVLEENDRTADVYNKVRPFLPTTSMPSVGNTLRQLTRAGLISRSAHGTYRPLVEGELTHPGAPDVAPSTVESATVREKSVVRPHFTHVVQPAAQKSRDSCKSCEAQLPVG